ncbi:unnamed protein product [Hermetia illucens]|uniref:Uncharacterized protein n=1 Tax=Hermetia illucens TaxID=343691 RepID=A0A7R8URG4_HERIL|nr:unnamed protein product [Hermetia illucens]
MKFFPSDDYKGIEAQRPLHRRTEELLRAEAARLHKRKTLKTLMKTGFKIRHVNVAHKYLKNSSRLIQHACDIYLAHLISKNKEYHSDLTRNEIIERGIEDFNNLDGETMSYYLSAAIVDDPGKSKPIASNAYHNFLVLHLQKQKRANKESNGDIDVEMVIKEGRKLWNRMRAHQKFPFFMLAYMNTLYPRELDGSIQVTIENLPPEYLRESLRNAEKTIKLIDAGSSGSQTEFAKSVKHAKFQTMNHTQSYIS